MRRLSYSLCLCVCLFYACSKTTINSLDELVSDEIVATTDSVRLGYTKAAVVTQTSYYSETDEAFPNPMKGFRPVIGPAQKIYNYHEYGTVYKQYIRYKDLEWSKLSVTQKMIDWCNTSWSGMGLAERNIKVIPRVVLTYPKNSDYMAAINNFWPIDIPQPDEDSRWYTQELQDRLAKFIYKLGEAWDNDPRVAAVEIGLWGYWGEHNILIKNGKISLSMQTALGKAATAAFKNKKVMVRYPYTFTDFNFGCYWDSFALPDDKTTSDALLSRDIWRLQMISGEVAYNWGDLSLIGTSPDATLASDTYTNSIIGWIEKVHASSLGWIDKYTASNAEIEKNAKRVQKALGYRYVIKSATYPVQITPGTIVPFSFDVSNIGAAPFYYNWPVEISLLDSNRKLMWKTRLPNDIRVWRPDNTYTVTADLAIPTWIPKGTYTWAVTIVDRGGGFLPSLRFANKNYYNGGRTPLGVVGVGTTRSTSSLGSFDSLYSDHSLFYTTN